ncbi:MAG: PcfJ domain-containing protein [Candidatus Paceibacterota bacterium]|jgi:hypothetical protein
METKFKNEEKKIPDAKYEIEFLQTIEEEVNAAIEKTPENKREEIRQKTEEALCALSLDLPRAKSAILKLKLIQYFQNDNEIDAGLLREAIFETPNFLKGSLKNLIETYRTRTFKQTREKMRRRIEMNDKETFNPHIVEFETDSGNYYLARLLNQPHLTEEGKEMNHCIGAPSSASSYIYRMKAGDIDTFSFRKKDGDFPVVTIEYDRNKDAITQIKKNFETKLSPSDPFFNDLVEALKKMEETVDDDGNKRIIKSVLETSEYIGVSPNHICTERGEIPYADYDPEKDALVLSGKIEATSATTKEELDLISKIPSATTDLTKLRPELKHSLTEWRGNIIDVSANQTYSNLETVNGFMEVKNAKTFEAPRLAFVGESLIAGETIDFNLPCLQSVGGILNAYRARTFKAPLLQMVDGPIAVGNADIFEAPALKKVKYIGLSSRISDKNINISKEMREKILR